MQVEDDHDAVRVQQVDIVYDGLLVLSGGEGTSGKAVDAKPTVLVEWDADGVDMPGDHGSDRGGVIGAIEGGCAIADTFVFCASTIDAKRANHLIGTI